MRNAPFKTKMTLGLLACGLSLLSPSAPAEVRIMQVETDGRVRDVSVESIQSSAPLRIASTVRTMRLHFTEADSNGKPSTRLRYKLEGYDDTWQDLPVKMRAIIYFRDRSGQVVGSSEFYLSGETPGWRGSIEASDFVARRETATAPARTASARLSFISHGGNEGVGLFGVDGVRLLVEQATGKPPKVHDLSVTLGAELAHPLGSPANWVREGSRAELAVLLRRAEPAPHPILAIQDDSPFFFGNWALSAFIPVAPSNLVTLEWQTAHSIGGSGAGQAEYSRLKPGRYWFRVATAKANGELTGQEVSLPLVVVAPLYQRWEFWLVTGALAAAAAAWIGRVAVQRKMQRQVAAMEQEQAMERERARIARDLHDNIGAGLTEIAMQSDWVHSDLAQGPTSDTRQRVERIRQSATELARSVDEIVWAINPANDTVKRFVNYLTQCTAQFLDAAGLRVRFDIPEEMPSTALAGKVRHCLFLAVREALNNAVRHARADLVRLEIRAENSSLRLAVEDSGCGFAPEQTTSAGTQEGLTNMRRRMEDIGGRFEITSRPGGGTRVEFIAPLPGECPTPTRTST
jgi:signal transduction histidine kinase